MSKKDTKKQSIFIRKETDTSSAEFKRMFDQNNRYMKNIDRSRSDKLNRDLRSLEYDEKPSGTSVRPNSGGNITGDVSYGGLDDKTNYNWGVSNTNTERYNNKRLIRSITKNNALLSKEVGKSVVGIDKMVSFQQNVQSKYYEKSLANQYTMINELKEIKNALMIGFSIDPKTGQKMEDSYDDNNRKDGDIMDNLFFKNGFSGFKQGLGQVGSNMKRIAINKVKSQIPGMQMLDMIGSMDKDMLINMGLSMGKDEIVKFIGNQIGKMSGGRNNELQQWMTDPKKAVRNQALFGKSSGAGALLTSLGIDPKIIGEILGVSIDAPSMNSALSEDQARIKSIKKERAIFDGRAHYALTTMIPDLLAKQLAVMTGNGSNQLVMNWDTGKWIDTKTADDISNKVGYSQAFLNARKNVANTYHARTDGKGHYVSGGIIDDLINWMEDLIRYKDNDTIKSMNLEKKLDDWKKRVHKYRDDNSKVWDTLNKLFTELLIYFRVRELDDESKVSSFEIFLLRFNDNMYNSNYQAIMEEIASASNIPFGRIVGIVRLLYTGLTIASTLSTLLDNDDTNWAKDTMETLSFDIDDQVIETQNEYAKNRQKMSTNYINGTSIYMTGNLNKAGIKLGGSRGSGSGGGILSQDDNFIEVNDNNKNTDKTRQLERSVDWLEKLTDEKTPMEEKVLLAIKSGGSVTFATDERHDGDIVYCTLRYVRSRDGNDTIEKKYYTIHKDGKVKKIIGDTTYLDQSNPEDNEIIKKLVKDDEGKIVGNTKNKGYAQALSFTKKEALDTLNKMKSQINMNSSLNYSDSIFEMSDDEGDSEYSKNLIMMKLNSYRAKHFGPLLNAVLQFRIQYERQLSKDGTKDVDPKEFLFDRVKDKLMAYLKAGKGAAFRLINYFKDKIIDEKAVENAWNMISDGGMLSDANLYRLYTTNKNFANIVESHYSKWGDNGAAAGSFPNLVKEVISKKGISLEALNDLVKDKTRGKGNAKIANMAFQLASHTGGLAAGDNLFTFATKSAISTIISRNYIMSSKLLNAFDEEWTKGKTQAEVELERAKAEDQLVTELAGRNLASAGGAKIHKWMKNNLRYGGVIGFAANLMFSTMFSKLGGKLFKAGKGILNFVGRKLFGTNIFGQKIANLKEKAKAEREEYDKLANNPNRTPEEEKRFQELKYKSENGDGMSEVEKAIAEASKHTEENTEEIAENTKKIADALEENIDNSNDNGSEDDSETPELEEVIEENNEVLEENNEILEESKEILEKQIEQSNDFNEQILRSLEQMKLTLVESNENLLKLFRDENGDIIKPNGIPDVSKKDDRQGDGITILNVDSIAKAVVDAFTKKEEEDAQKGKSNVMKNINIAVDKESGQAMAEDISRNGATALTRHEAKDIANTLAKTKADDRNKEEPTPTVKPPVDPNSKDDNKGGSILDTLLKLPGSIISNIKNLLMGGLNIAVGLAVSKIVTSIVADLGGKALSNITQMFGMEPEEAEKNADNVKERMSERFVPRLAIKGAGAFVNGALRGASKMLLHGSADVAKIGVEAADDVAKQMIDIGTGPFFTALGKLGGWIGKWLVKTWKKIVGPIAEFFGKSAKKVAEEMTEEAIEEATKRAGTTLTKWIPVVGWAVGIGTTLYGFWSGWRDAHEVFEIPKTEVLTSMKVSAALARGLIEAGSNIPYIGLMITVLGFFFERDLAKLIFQLLQAFGFGKDYDIDNKPKFRDENNPGDLSDVDPSTMDSKELQRLYSSANSLSTNMANMKQQTSKMNSGTQVTAELLQQMATGGNGYGVNSILTSRRQYVNKNPLGGMGSFTQAKSLPTFVSQLEFGEVRLGGVNAVLNGCALACAKMINLFYNKGLTDKEIISQATRYLLDDKSVSTDFFNSLKGKQIQPQNWLDTFVTNSGMIVILINVGSSYHFMTMYNKDGMYYMGDPMSEYWKQVSDIELYDLDVRYAASFSAESGVSHVHNENILGGSGIGSFFRSIGEKIGLVKPKTPDAKPSTPQSTTTPSTSSPVITNQTNSSQPNNSIFGNPAEVATDPMSAYYSMYNDLKTAGKVYGVSNPYGTDSLKTEDILSMLEPSEDLKKLTNNGKIKLTKDAINKMNSIIKSTMSDLNSAGNMCNPEGSSTIRERLVRIVLGEIRKAEVSKEESTWSASDPNVQHVMKYLIAAYYNTATPTAAQLSKLLAFDWCGSFTAWATLQAGVRYPKGTPLTSGAFPTTVPSVMKEINPNDAVPGDIACWVKTVSNGYNHAAVIVEVEKNSSGKVSKIYHVGGNQTFDKNKKTKGVTKYWTTAPNFTLPDVNNNVRKLRVFRIVDGEATSGGPSCMTNYGNASFSSNLSFNVGSLKDGGSWKWSDLPDPGNNMKGLSGAKRTEKMMPMWKALSGLTGIPADIYAVIAAQESGMDPLANRNGGGPAKGLYQYLYSAYRSRLAHHIKANRAHGLTAGNDSDVYDPRKAATIFSMDLIDTARKIAGSNGTFSSAQYHAWHMLPALESAMRNKDYGKKLLDVKGVTKAHLDGNAAFITYGHPRSELYNATLGYTLGNIQNKHSSKMKEFGIAGRSSGKFSKSEMMDNAKVLYSEIKKSTELSKIICGPYSLGALLVNSGAFSVHDAVNMLKYITNKYNLHNGFTLEFFNKIGFKPSKNVSASNSSINVTDKTKIYILYGTSSGITHFVGHHTVDGTVAYYDSRSNSILDSKLDNKFTLESVFEGDVNEVLKVLTGVFTYKSNDIADIKIDSSFIYNTSGNSDVKYTSYGRSDNVDIDSKMSSAKRVQNYANGNTSNSSNDSNVSLTKVLSLMLDVLTKGNNMTSEQVNILKDIRKYNEAISKKENKVSTNNNTFNLNKNDAKKAWAGDPNSAPGEMKDTIKQWEANPLGIN